MQLAQTNASVNNRPHRSLEGPPAVAVNLLGVSSSVVLGAGVSKEPSVKVNGDSPDLCQSELEEKLTLGVCF